MGANEQFLRERLTGLGGSDIGAILGLSKYKTPVDVWLQKTGRAKDDESSLPARFGIWAEEFVASEYVLREGRKVERYKKMMRHESAPMLAHVDRLVIPEGRGQAFARRTHEIFADTVLECKTANAFVAMDKNEWGPDGTDQVPMSYLVQTVSYTAITKCPYADLAVLFGNMDFRVYHIKRDLDLEEEVIARSTEWWNNYVVKDVPPPAMTADDIKLLFPRSYEGRSVEAEPQIVEALNELRQVSIDLSDNLGAKKTLEVLIKDFMKDAAILTVNEKPVYTFKNNCDSVNTSWQTVAEQLANGYSKQHVERVVQANTTKETGARVFRAKQSKE